MSRYTPLYRPPGHATLPKAQWILVEAPRGLPGALHRHDLPRSQYTWGVVVFDRELTPEEIEAFELREVP